MPAGSIFFHLFIINSSSKFIWFVVHYCIVHIFPKRSIILWTKGRPGSRTRASCLLSNHGMTLRSLDKGPEGVSHFLSRITLAHRFCKLITSWTHGLFASCPQTTTPVVKYYWDQAQFSFRFVNNIPSGKAKRKENLIPSTKHLPPTFLIDWHLLNQPTKTDYFGSVTCFFSTQIFHTWENCRLADLK